MDGNALLTISKSATVHPFPQTIDIKFSSKNLENTG
jgi:hypothetical protein